MRVLFESSHVAGAARDGRLRLAVTRPDDTAGQSRYDVVSFDVPPDFHAHHDSVASALLTLVGGGHDEVRFNFPISSRCAAILRAHYQLGEIGPVDPSLEPRRPGAALGLAFSGGTDSVLARVLLEQELGADVWSLATEFDVGAAHETLGLDAWPPRIRCRTDHHRGRLLRHGRFDLTAPLLYADYLDLGRLATGITVFEHLLPAGDTLASMRHGAAALDAAGIEEIHLVRALDTPAVLRALIQLAPERVEPALRASSPPRTNKYVLKALLLIRAYEQLGLPVPAFLSSVEPAPRPYRFNRQLYEKTVLLLLRDYGAAYLEPHVAGLAGFDPSLFDRVTLDLCDRYHPGVVAQLPADLHDRVVALFHRLGIPPWDARDARESAFVAASYFTPVRQLTSIVPDPADPAGLITPASPLVEP